jgi:hypothetical protein
MSEVAENSQWYKGKQPIVEEFSGQHRALLSTLAGRNFCKPPGFLMEASLALEEVGKNKLSALNYQIVAESIERELKQTGHNYTQLYKAARIAFELEKQTLLTALQQEFANMDAAQSLTEEELNLLFVELDVRRIILIATKTAIELEMEDLKQELAGVDRLTFTKEELLINEKVVTATAKLTVIPYLETLIEAQKQTLSAEESNISHSESLVAKKELLLNKKEEVLPYIEDKANMQIALADKKEELIPYIEDKAASQIELATKKEELIPYTENKVNKQLEVITAKKETLPYLENKVIATEELLVEKENLFPLMSDKNDAQIQLIAKKEELLPHIETNAVSLAELANKKSEMVQYIETKAEAQTAFAQALIDSIPKEQDIMAEGIKVSELRKELIYSKGDILQVEGRIEALRADLKAAMFSRQGIRVENQNTFLTADIANIAEASAENTTTLGNLITDRSQINSGNMDTAAIIADNKITGQDAASSAVVTAQTQEITSGRMTDKRRIKGVASAQAAAKITSKLIHLIGS